VLTRSGGSAAVSPYSLCVKPRRQSSFGHANWYAIADTSSPDARQVQGYMDSTVSIDLGFATPADPTVQIEHLWFRFSAHADPL